MKIFLSRLLTFLFVTSPILSFSPVAQAEISNITSAINQAGRQRMLTQRIVATYCQVGMEIQRDQSRKQLNEAIQLFDQQLSELKQYSPEGTINDQLNKVEQLWLPMKTLATKEVTRNNASELREHAEEVLRASHKVVILLQDQGGSQTGRIVNISGRQRMLSQKMSSLYMLKSWNFTSSEYNFDYSTAINEFKGALTELLSSSMNSEDIKISLDKARRQFGVLERSLLLKEGEYIPLMVKLSTDKLLVLMNDVTQMYEELARKEQSVNSISSVYGR